MKREAEALGLPARVLGDDALAALQRAEWPGNVRELRNLIARLLILAPDDPRRVIGADVLPTDLPPGRAVPRADRDHRIMTLPLREAREIFEREYLAAQINRFGGNISRTATFVGMERSALHRKLKTLGVQGEDRLARASG
jgi:two-component system nitrogen regulation response regulator NtrX